MLRVISGIYRNRKLEQPPLSITRPTMDRVKEAIFNVIQFKIKDSICLDLFAGSGSLSIEAVSRGAMKSIAVDKSKEAIDVINKNINSININNISVIKQDVISFVKAKTGAKFDFIFLDPPFSNFEIYSDTLETINDSKLLKDLGLIILETKNPQKIKIPKGFIIKRQKKYGISYLIMLGNNI